VESTEGYPVSVVGSKSYSYGQMELDILLGYPAIDSFERHHEGFIVAMAEEDLKKRGFIVKDLRLYLGNVTDVIPKGEKLCDKDALAECKCEHHGVCS